MALLVGADTYGNRAWNIDVADDTVRQLRDVLVDTLHFAPRDVLVLSGDAVYEKNVEAKIDGLTRDLQGIDNTLLVVWVGHGFEIQGRQQFLTALSRGGGSQGFTETIPYDAVLGWIGAARTRLRDGGGDLQTAMVVDACRTPTGGTPGRIRDHEPVLDVEAFGARMGTPTTYGDKSFVFTGALTRSLQHARGSRVGLLDAVHDAERATLDELEGAQQPDILTGDHDVVLLDRGNLAITIRAVDQVSDSAIEGSTIELAGETKSGPQAVFTGLDASSTGYFLRIEAPGYFARQMSITVPAEKSGQSLVVPLQPEYVEIIGHVSLSGTGTVRVEVTGTFDGLVPGYHAATSGIDPQGGGFVLRVPPTAGPRSLLVKVGDKVAYEEPFDLATREKRTAQNRDGTIFDLYSFGRLRAVASGPIDIGAKAERQIVDGFEFDWSTITEEELGGGIPWSFYKGARDHAEAKDYEAAIFRLDRLHKEANVSRTTDRKLGDLVERLEIARVITLANELQRTDLDAAIDVLLKSPAHDRREVKDELKGWLMESAAARYADADYAKAVERLDQAEEAGWPASEIRAQRAQVLSDWVEDAYEQAFRDGDWSRAREAVTALEKAHAPGTLVKEWQDKVDQESISPACRRHYEEGLQAVDAGDLEQAMASFDAALAEGCNAHYGSLIHRHEDGIKGDALNKRLAAGRRLERSGKIAEAFDEYLQAARISTLAMAYVDPLLANPTNVELLGAERPDALAQLRLVTAADDLADAKQAEASKDYDGAAALYERAADAFEASGDAASLASALHGQARACDPYVNAGGQRSSWPESVALYARAAAAYDASGNAPLAAECTYLSGWGLGFLHNDARDPVASVARLADAAKRFEVLGDTEGQAKSLLYRGRYLLPEGDNLDVDWAGAQHDFTTAANLFKQAGTNDHLRGEALFGIVRCMVRDHFTPEQASAEACEILKAAIEAKKKAGKSADAQDWSRRLRALNCG
ncbi:MAG: hypothetical protein H6825_05060 [Planctomycetes bacterium]|nr:hypothetical protein [Planctomycetota bacterium]